MLLARLASFNLDVKEALRTATSMKFPRPPDWVINEYLGEYMLWVQRTTDPEKVKELREVAYHQIPWTILLEISPRIDLWDRVEQEVYGECLLAEDVPGVKNYLQSRERRARYA